LCARCLGLYPALATALVFRLGIGAREAAWDSAVIFGLGAFGVVAWGLDRLRLIRVGNMVRATAGAMLGLSLGWMLALHFREPFAPAVVGHIAMIVSLFSLFSLLGVRLDRKVARDVLSLCDGREGRPDGASQT
jgi:hypothetical protein